MIVQHNLAAMNSNRMLGVNTSSQSKVTEKLSSGYKINRAADDAAGLSISEKMRRQIRGLTQA
ncbi:MAG: flagellin, partial [Clostridium sp.]|nr:flagellin [Clostridium sp.]